MMLQCTRAGNYFFKFLLLILVELHGEVKLLDHMAIFIFLRNPLCTRVPTSPLLHHLSFSVLLIKAILMNGMTFIVTLIWFCPASSMAPVVTSVLSNAGDFKDTSLNPGLGRSPGGGHGNPLQYSCQENPMDREAS